MSTKYRQVNIANVQNLTDLTQAGMAKLMQADPMLYRKLAKVDMTALTNYVLQLSMKELAKQSKGRFVAEQKNLGRGYYESDSLPAGQFLGAIEKGDARLVFMRTRTGLQCVQQVNSHGRTTSRDLDTLEKKFQQIYRSQAQIAYSQLLSSDGEVEVEESDDLLITRYEREV